MDKTYSFAGVNAWCYSGNRAIVWFGKGHWGEKKRYLTYCRGRAGYLGAEVVVGGEDREVTLSLGLLFTTLYIGITGLLRCDHEKLQSAAINGIYKYEIDYTDNGARTGLMILLWGECAHINATLWNQDLSSSNRPAREKLRNWPYCEGLSWWYPWFDRWFGLQFYSEEKLTETETHDYKYTLESGEVQQERERKF